MAKTVEEKGEKKRRICSGDRGSMRRRWTTIKKEIECAQKKRGKSKPVERS